MADKEITEWKVVLGTALGSIAFFLVLVWVFYFNPLTDDLRGQCFMGLLVLSSYIRWTIRRTLRIAGVGLKAITGAVTDDMESVHARLAALEAAENDRRA